MSYGSVKLSDNLFKKVKENEKVESPGMKYKHYAPNSKCILVYSDNNEALINKINELSISYKTPLILSTTENIPYYNDKLVIDIGSRNNLDEIAKNIFTDLRKVDKFNPDIVIIEGVRQEGLGLAIMNRLIRACSHNFIVI